MHKPLFTDTETTGGLDNPLVYDFGAHGLKDDFSLNLVSFEIFYDHDLMDTAYYKDKLPAYRDEIWESKRIVEDFFRIRDEIHRLFKEGQYNVIVAHNASFDVRALNNTCRYLSGDKIRYFFPYGVEVWDTLKMARQVLGKMPAYRKFCEAHGYMTNHATPRPRMTAEIIYRFITKDNEFKEAHTGLKDVKIEMEIYRYIMRQHRKCDPTLYPRKTA